MVSPDLHTHTSLSDGVLSPAELIERAIDKGVTHLAITDHDTIAAYRDLPGFATAGLTVVPGIELSSRWRHIGVHIIGLNIDPHNAALQEGIRMQQRARRQRAQEIAARLQKLGLPDLLPEAKQIAGSGTIGRPHFARLLVRGGHSKDIATAFRKYLGNGKAGDVRHFWQPMTEVIRWISAAGGSAVLAHPTRYKLTGVKLRELVRAFRDAGGDAIEVVSGAQREEVTSKLATLANDYGLAASCGSDFHHPARRWSDLGQFPALPPDVVPVWEQWKTTAQFA